MADRDGEDETTLADADIAEDDDTVEGADAGEDAETTQDPVGLSACPNPLVIQTDWFPEPEHGALYQLTAGVGSIDAETGRFQGPLAADPELTIEIRVGGPFVGFQLNPLVMRDDETIFLAYVDTNSQIIGADLGVPTLAVVAPLERNPQILMWDPATYDFESFSDIGESGAVVRVFGFPNWVEYLVFTGQLSRDQIDESYDGSPDRFIEANGAIVQQGFASQEPWNYENLFEDWGRPVDFLLVHESGFQIYSQSLAIRTDRLDAAARSCLTAFVPLVQQAAIDFMVDPAAANAAILQAVEDLESFWSLSPEGVANSVVVMDALELVANGPNDTLGDFDMDRVQSVIDLMDAMYDAPVFEGLTPEDLVTNEFVDPSLGR